MEIRYMHKEKKLIYNQNKHHCMKRFTEKPTDRLDIMWATICVQALTESMKLSVWELEKSNNPKALKYIESMNKWIMKMKEVNLVIKSMDDELKVINRMNFNYHMESMDLRNQISDLKTKLERLTNL